MIEQVATRDTLTVRVAYEPAEIGEVIRTRVTVASAVATKTSVAARTAATRIARMRRTAPF